MRTLVSAQLPEDYTKLQNVSIGVAVGSAAAERTALAIDDVEHTNFPSICANW